MFYYGRPKRARCGCAVLIRGRQTSFAFLCEMEVESGHHSNVGVGSFSAVTTMRTRKSGRGSSSTGKLAEAQDARHHHGPRLSSSGCRKARQSSAESEVRFGNWICWISAATTRPMGCDVQRISPMISARSFKIVGDGLADLQTSLSRPWVQACA